MAGRRATTFDAVSGESAKRTLQTGGSASHSIDGKRQTSTTPPTPDPRR
ncbi:hypothetical protein GZL_04105 [Streptomyces sp. 769]|nr:hypothetical protein GZL_04105 [Streptomyces sp. 769]